MKKPLIGIIGGTGLMGKLFEEFFKRQGMEVLISSRKTKLSLRECAEKADVVVISVPMDKTAEVIEEVAPLIKEDGLLMDLTSLKKEPLELMLKYARCSVIGTHPVFGPGVKNFKNQTIVVCPGRGEEWQEWLIDLFNKEQVKIKITSADYHDRMMAVIQGLIHFTTITMAKTLQELGIDIGESREFSSPIYKLRLDMVGRILNQDPALYANIEIMNPMTPEVLSAYLKSTRELFSIVEQKDKEGFCKVFEEAADYLGDFKKEAEEYSNYLIRQLVYKEDSNE